MPIWTLTYTISIILEGGALNLPLHCVIKKPNESTGLLKRWLYSYAEKTDHVIDFMLYEIEYHIRKCIGKCKYCDVIYLCKSALNSLDNCVGPIECTMYRKWKLLQKFKFREQWYWHQLSCNLGFINHVQKSLQHDLSFHDSK